MSAQNARIIVNSAQARVCVLNAMTAIRLNHLPQHVQSKEY